MTIPASLFENVGLLRLHAERITDDPHLSASSHPSAMLSIAYLGDGLVPMGVLVRLWTTGDWSAACPHCRGLALIVAVGGSPLSGSHGWSGACVDCRARVAYRDAPGSSLLPHATSFARLWQAAYPWVLQRQPATVLLRGRPASFTIALACSPISDEAPMSFDELLGVLRRDS